VISFLLRLLGWCTSAPTSHKTACCAGNIPKEFGLCTALKVLSLRDNQLTGERLLLRLIGWSTTLKTTFLLRRQHSHGIRPLHGTEGARTEDQQIDW
jgi:hypothetical protein